MKINIASSRVLHLLISPQHAKDDAESDTSTPDARTQVDDVSNAGEERQAFFGARVKFFDNFFCVVFKTEIHTDEGMCVDLEYESRFNINVPVDEEFKSSNFPYVNAPAIAYPYLRAFISNLTLNAGFAPVMLPSLNFVAMKDKIKAASV
ncbi:protein-export chaperone SecB [Pseudomonas glycinae]|uniref:protein-export chaperone SecB n=1 Tax=Pseudomonas glycinae TaxID=1785145 RepID=UPI001F159974|nr:protein-export chaperone SecB [Pseudomonas glycinae]